MYLKLHYLDAPAGAGKTYAIQGEIERFVNHGERIILCQPTTQLLDQTAKGLRDRFPDVHQEVFYAENEFDRVVGRITKYLGKPYPEPHVLMITWEAFQRLGFIPNREAWNLIVDEIPQVQVCFDEVLSRTHRVITDYLCRESPENEQYAYLLAGDPTEIRKIAENRDGDAGYQVFRELAVRIESRHWSNFVDRGSYERLLESKSDSKKLTVFSFLRPSIFEGFKSVLIAGACFTDSLLFKYFSKQGVTFHEAKHVKDSLRYTQHQNGQTLTILYATDKPWSKNLRDKDQGKAWSTILETVKKEFGDGRFVWSANKDIRETPFGTEFNQIRLPLSPYGLNHYQHIDNVAFLSAHNLMPSHAKFIQQHLGIERDELDTAIHRQSVYQAVLRGSTRDPENKNPKRVFVPDLPTANWLCSQFPGSKIQKVECGLDATSASIGRPKKHESNAERTAAYRRNRKATIEALIEDLSAPKTDSFFIENSCDENALESYRTFITSFRGSIFANIRATECTRVLKTSLVEFESVLEKLSKREIPTKEENGLLSPSLFDPSRSEQTSRGKENFLIANGIWLDFDGGDIGPNDFASMYPTLRMTIYATFSSTKGDMRFRVFIPTSSPLDYETYQGITHHILSDLIEAGYVSKKQIPGTETKAHGLDTGKLNPISLFYLPCQPKDQSGKFFKTFKNKCRMPLDVNEWIEKLEAPETQPNLEALSFRSGSLDQAKIEKAIQQWQTEGVLPGEGNLEFFKLANRLANAGMNEFELAQTLRDQAAFANTPKDRIGDIPRILEQLRKEEKLEI